MVSVLYMLLAVNMFYCCTGYDKDKLCEVCHVIVDEIEHEISKVDPKKVIEVEGFRVDPAGNLKRKQIPFARSETHLTEIAEQLCEKMNHYALSRNEETGKQTYVRTAAWDKGEQIELNNVDMSSEIVEELRNMCNSVVEEHEDGIVEYFRKPSDNSKNEFCMDIVELTGTRYQKQFSVRPRLRLCLLYEPGHNLELCKGNAESEDTEEDDTFEEEPEEYQEKEEL